MKAAVQIYNNSHIYISVCNHHKSKKNGSECITWSGNKAGKRKNTERAEMSVEDIKRSCKRAYVKLCRIAESIKVDRMLTLTFAKNITIDDRDIANKIFRRFIVKLTEECGDFYYVAVPELQKRGAIHYHLGLTRYFEVYQLWRIWKEAIVFYKMAAEEDKVGSVFINKKAKQAKQGVARYIAKYIFKNGLSTQTLAKAATQFNQKRYYASKINVEKMIVEDSALNIYDENRLEWYLDIFHNIKTNLKNGKFVQVGLFGYSWYFASGLILQT